MKFIKVEHLKTELKTAVVSLNRPEVKNAFHPEMIAEITQFFESLDTKTDLVVLKGEGSVFCSGADLSWMQSMVNYNREENRIDSKKLWQMFLAIQKCQAPVITIVSGAVYGGALGLLAVSDYVIAHEKTQFCFSEVKLGLAPAVISDFITQKISSAVVGPLMLSAEVFSSEKALQMGLVHQIQNLDTESAAQIFLKNGPEAMRATKKLLQDLRMTSQTEARMNLCTEVITERRLSSEAQERLLRFLEKSKKDKRS